MPAIRKLTVVLIWVALGSAALAQVTPPTPPGPAGPAPNVIPPFNLGGPGFNPNALSNLLPGTMGTSPTAITPAPSDLGKPETTIAEAAGTLTDPMDFIYLSKEAVFNLLALASALGVPGVQFNSDALPRLRDTQVSGDSSRGGSREGTRTRSGRSSSSEMEVAWIGGGGSESGRRAVRGAQFLSGQREGGRTVATPSETNSDQMLNAITVTNNEELAKLPELVKDLPGWQRVGRFPLQTTEKQKLDKAISAIYAQAFRALTPGGGQPQYGPGYPNYQGGGSNTYAVNPDYGTAGSPPAPGTAPGMPPGAPGAPGQPQGPPPIDPQAMGEWYYFYQQAIAWERYVNEEVLLLKPGEPADLYELGSALQPQELYMAPQGPNAPPSVIHFDTRETPISLRLSAVKPGSMQPALDQVSRVMEKLAKGNATKDSDRSRAYVARLDARKERRYAYREWLNDQTKEARKIANDYRRRLAGEEFVIDGVQYLVSRERLSSYPRGSRPIVTERLTPYDLLDNDGTLKKATEESVEQTP